MIELLALIIICIGALHALARLLDVALNGLWHILAWATIVRQTWRRQRTLRSSPSSRQASSQASRSSTSKSSASPRPQPVHSDKTTTARRRAWES